MLSRWLDKWLGSTPASPTVDERHAAAALLYEVARADGQWQESEAAVFRQRLAQRWQLSEDDVTALVEQGRHLAEHATDYHDLLKALRDWSPEQRRELVFDLWAVAHADGRVDAHEEYVIRKIADLLHVSHRDFIRGKLSG